MIRYYIFSMALLFALSGCNSSKNSGKPSKPRKNKQGKSPKCDVCPSFTEMQNDTFYINHL